VRQQGPSRRNHLILLQHQSFPKVLTAVRCGDQEQCENYVYIFYLILGGYVEGNLGKPCLQNLYMEEKITEIPCQFILTTIRIHGETMFA